MSFGVSPIGFAVSTLAVWRIAHLFWGEDGPWSVFVRLRRLAGQSFFGSLLDCFYCLSLWVAAPLGFLLGASWLERLLLWFALSGGAILLERSTAPKEPPRAVWHSEPISEDSTKEAAHDVLLR